MVPQVEMLLQRGKRVRALVRDEARGRQLLVRHWQHTSFVRKQRR